MNSAESNTYSHAADAARARWTAHVDGSREAAVCVVSGEAAADAVRSALNASFERLGYGAGACTFVDIDHFNAVIRHINCIFVIFDFGLFYYNRL